MEELQKRLGYSFRDPDRLSAALTHSSYANEHRCPSNERLEFLGDSVLGMVVAAHLYRTFPELPEGRMTRMRSELVCEQSLWEAARQLGLGDYIRLGKGEDQTGGRRRPSILADCVEAIIAAIYLDGGLECAREFIHTVILSKLTNSVTPVSDYKTELQELVQQTPGNTVSYELTGESGPDHDKRFAFVVRLKDETLGSGEGRTKKEAEQMAARAALERLKA